MALLTGFHRVDAAPELTGRKTRLRPPVAADFEAWAALREASRAFAIPTYLFIGSVALMVIVGLVRTALGDPPIASSAEYGVKAEDLSQAAVLLLVEVVAGACEGITSSSGGTSPERTVRLALGVGAESVNPPHPATSTALRSSRIARPGLTGPLRGPS